MRIALDRITGPIFGWIPDISAAPLRRQVTVGIIASLALHLLAILLVALLAGVLPKPAELVAARPMPEELELQIIRPEEPKILPAPAAEEKAFIDSRGLAESKAAAKPVFESDKDMTAASEKPATGDLPLPSQEGKGRFDNVFETQRSAVGSVKEPPVPDVELAPPPAPAASAQPPGAAPSQPKTAAVPPAATPAPAATPRPKTEEKSDAAEVAQRTLEKLREVETKNDRELALAARPLPALPTPVTKMSPPAPEPIVLPGIPVRPSPQQMAKLTTPSPLLRSPGKPGYQPEQEKSRVEGKITNRGKSAVDAVATPLGKYKKQVYDAIGSRWLFYVKDQSDMLAIGTAKVSFAVTSAGRVKDIQVVANTANASFAEVCERAIRDAELSRPPAGLLEEMRDGRLEYTITFTLYSFRE